MINISPKILLITNKDDFAIDYLILKLAKRDIQYLRINSEDITNFRLSYVLDNSIELKYSNYIYNLKEIKSVYFRRAPSIFPKAVNFNDTTFINRERRDFLEGLYLSMDAKWINPVFATYKAERKIYQLTVAKKIGFNVPRTLGSNNPSKVISFIKENNECIIKPISHGLQVTKDGIYSIYTSKVINYESIDDKEIFESPVLIQEKIDNYRDIRATVIGDRIFAVEIDTDENNKIDWRKPNLNKTYKIHQLPTKIKELIFKLHKELNLIYSAFDFILTTAGEYYFLETNPAGEWVWLERELNIPISEAIIDELMK